MNTQNNSQPEALPRVEMLGRSPLRSRPVHLNFFVVFDNTVHEGVSFTLDEMTVYAAPAAQEGGDIPPLPKPGESLQALLRINLHGFTFEVKTRAILRQHGMEASDPTLTFAFENLAPTHREALRRIIRSYHAGLVASPSDLLDRSDDPTFAETTDGAEQNTTRGRNLLTLGLSFAVILGALGFIATALYDHAVFVPARFATVTAARLDLRAPEMGQVSSRITAVGTRVARDAPLYSISVDALDTERFETTAKLEALSIASASGGGVATAPHQDTPPTAAPGYLQPAFSLASLDTLEFASDDGDLAFAADAEARPASVNAAAGEPAVGQAETRALLMARQRALEMRKTALDAYAPCDCIVQWYQEDGAWVLAGDLVMTLTRADPEALRIETLVPVADARNLAVGQGGAVVTPISGAPFHATIERITLTPDAQPRFGFPDRLRREDTLASVLLKADQPLDAAQIGQPLEVVLRRNSLVARLFGSGA
ncbi:HlyD family secretion protein [Rhodobacter aestuarii]|uniref:HlyD family secretion protein n=1 Tax=Rhodobacter aestuarii TaxID=453582 RepID=A0A1N7MTM1_9RHOB|nr:HlyD family secretion protein [Rhodobacter aestuarii]PTV96544.1 HlyD family secretion protein [Rhodobacter aestuarii]SIS89402.1 HlyD family secretion protein [Rhodobacter aestuarii]